MLTYKSKLIVLRGNSGSGKSTVAEKLRKIIEPKTALVSQDNLRRKILKEKETDVGDNIDLIQQTVEFALGRHYNVILEGILYFPRYKFMLKRLVERCPESYVYYFDIPFDETLKRHATKPNAHEFGEKEMREWYKNKDFTDFQNEKIISAKHSLDQIVSIIASDTHIKVREYKFKGIALKAEITPLARMSK